VDDDLVAALSRPDLPPGYERWHVELRAGQRRPTSAAEWADALVLVVRGTVEVECAAGGRRRLGTGTVVAPGWLPLVALRNPGDAPARLLAVRRRGRRDAPTRPPSTRVA
jgi:hypothetical protein